MTAGVAMANHGIKKRYVQANISTKKPMLSWLKIKVPSARRLHEKMTSF